MVQIEGSSMKVVRLSDKNFEPASHEDAKHPGVLKKVLLSREDLDPVCGLKMVNYAEIKVGEAFALHYHESLEEVFYILDGKAEITINDETEILEKDMAVLIPRNAQHIMKNIGQVPLKYLAFGASSSDGATVVVS